MFLFKENPREILNLHKAWISDNVHVKRWDVIISEHGCDFKNVIFKFISWVSIFTSIYANVLKWMSRDLTGDKSPLFQVMVFAVRQAITGANVDQYQCHHMASLGHNELIYIMKV